MKKKYLIIIAAALLIANFAAAQPSTPSYFKKIGNAIIFNQPAYELGASASRIAKGWFTNLDATSATIGTLQISSKIDPGPLVVTASTNPTIRFTGDTDSGIGWLEANKMSLMTNNANALTVDSTGNVGIGTTLPGGRLDIHGAGTTTGINTQWADLNGVAKVSILDSGNVGIGTTSPLAKLQVGSTNYYTGVATYPGSILVANGANNGPNSSNGIEFESSLGGSGYATKLFGDNANDRFGIAVRYNSAAWTDVLTIKEQTGNVGIGTTSPGAKLEVNGGMRLNTATAKPTCAVGIRGTIWYVAGGAGVADTAEICGKDASDVYAWRALY